MSERDLLTGHTLLTGQGGFLAQSVAEHRAKHTVYTRESRAMLMDIGEFARTTRMTLLRVKQVAMAEQVGITPQMLSDLEKGKRLWNDSLIVKWDKAVAHYLEAK